MRAVKLPKLVLLALVGAALLGVAPRANATIVERIVAVIGERPILWTDLLHRAVSARIQIRMQTHDPNVVSVQEQEMYKELLDNMINERLEEQQADKAHITVTPEEIDRGIANIAAQAQQQQGRPVTVQDVLAEVRRTGLTEQDFRDQIRREILEGKLIELRVRPRVHVTEQDARAAYQHWLEELKQQQPVDVRILAMRVPPDANGAAFNARMALAQQIVKWARSGTDFCKLVDQYSDDQSTKATCGSHGAQATSALLPPIQDAVRSMKPGEISDPIPIQLPQGDQAIAILMPLGQARVPPFEDVKSQMMQRAMIEGLDRERKQWLQELRRNVYINVRL